MKQSHHLIACFLLTLANGWFLAQAKLEHERAADDRRLAEKQLQVANEINVAAIASNRSWMAKWEFNR